MQRGAEASRQQMCPSCKIARMRRTDMPTCKVHKMRTPIELVTEVWRAATPVLAISGVGGRWWKRNVAKDRRIGPWLQASYKVVNSATWRSPGSCLYLVGASGGELRYVDISRNYLRHRWRESLPWSDRAD